MKTSAHFAFGIASSIGTAVFLAMTPVHSAPSPSGKSAAARVTQTNTAAQSTFVIPTTLKEGRDPFYPNAEYFLANRPVVKTAPTTPTAPAVELFCNGLSGPPERRLAIINYKTFATGEKQEVSTRGGRVLVHCVEIKEDSVVVEVNGKREVLQFSGK